MTTTMIENNADTTAKRGEYANWTPVVQEPKNDEVDKQRLALQALIADLDELTDGQCNAWRNDRSQIDD